MGQREVGHRQVVPAAAAPVNTTDSVGNVTTAAEAMAQRVRAAGFPDSDLALLGPNARNIAISSTPGTSSTLSLLRLRCSIYRTLASVA